MATGPDDVPAVARVSGKQDYEQQLERFGVAMKAARRAKGLTQDALADVAGIERAHLGKIERGERNVTLLNMIKIAAALDVPLAQLVVEAGL